MKIVPISKFEYKVFPIREGEPTIEITEEEYRGLERQTKCISDDMTKVIDYIKTDEEKEREAIFQRKEALKIEIYKLKRQLAQTDYKALKYVEGELSDDEYAPIKEQRRLLRQEINRLQSQITEV